MSDCLDTPRRDRRTAALDLAIAALRQIADEATTMGPEQTAEAVLQHIQTLVPEIDR
jgi:hypothetical protein